MNRIFDVVIVGGGPSGSACAAVCARAGLAVAVLERAAFPREKVCGDCLNPQTWPILQRLGLVQAVLQLPHAPLERVDFVDAQGAVLSCPLPARVQGEVAIKRSDLDLLLLQYARACGAVVVEEAAVTGVRRIEEANGGARWRVTAGEADYLARTLVAADGRNSTVARILGLLPPAAKDRVGWQTHLPLPAGVERSVIMRFLPAGYCGLADIGGGLANLCLVSAPARMAEVKAWATGHFGLPPEQSWRSVTPLERNPIAALGPGLLLVGDAARVVEPFTGEGIYYALATGELAARCLIDGTPDRYSAAHRELYRGRLWVNGFARLACKHPAFASAFLRFARFWPGLLRMLTRKVVR